MVAPEEPKAPIQKQPTQEIGAAENASWVARTKSFLDGFFEILDLVGQRVMGEIWKIVYLTVQEAIALSVLVRVPSQIGYWILGKDFSAFGVCSKEDPSGTSFWACYVIVGLDFALWIVLVPRFVIRFVKEIREAIKMKDLDAENSTRQEDDR